MIDTDIEIRAALSPGEKLLWTGAPPKGVRFGAQDLLLIPFSLLWGGFAFFWEWGVLQHGPTPFALFGIPFVAMGTYMIVGRFLVDASRRARTRYALTDQRIMIVSGRGGRQVKSISLKTLPELTLNEKAGGTGSIVFGSGSGPPGMNWFANAGWPGSQRYAAPSFDSIPDARNVYESIRKAQQNSK